MAAPGWSADFDSPGLTSTACDASTACDGSGSNWGGSSGGLSIGDGLLDLDVGHKPEEAVLPKVPPSPGRLSLEEAFNASLVVTEQAPVLTKVPSQLEQFPLFEAFKEIKLQAAGTPAVTEQAPTMQPPLVMRERGASQPEPAEEPPPVLEATVLQGAHDERPMPCAAVPTATTKEKDRFAALDELLGAKPVVEFGDLLSVFNERNPIAGLQKQGSF